MEVTIHTQSNHLSATKPDQGTFPEVVQVEERAFLSDEVKSRRKVEQEIYKSILYNLETKKVFLDSKLSLEKLSSIVGTNTTYLSNTVNRLFGCGFKRLLNRYRVAYATELLDGGASPARGLYRQCGFASKSVFYASFGMCLGMSPTQYLAGKRNPQEA